MGLFDFLKKNKKKKEGRVILNPDPVTRPAPVISPPVAKPSSPPPVPKADPASVTPPPVSTTPVPKLENPQPALKPDPAPAAPSVPVAKDEPKGIVVPAAKDGKKIKYHYDHVRIFTPKHITVDYDRALPGDEVSFVPEPTNAYDSKAVKVSHPSGNIGYLYKGKHQDMVNDYIKAGLPVYGHIDSTDDDNNQITVFMAFYGSASAPQKTKPYKLTGTKGKAAQEAIELLSEGDELEPSYDAEKDKYVLYDFTGEVIGALPKAADEHAEGKTCVVSSVEEDDNGKFDVFVYFE